MSKNSGLWEILGLSFVMSIASGWGFFLGHFNRGNIKPDLNPMVISRDLEDGLVTILEEDFEDLLERSGATSRACER